MNKLNSMKGVMKTISNCFSPEQICMSVVFILMFTKPAENSEIRRVHTHIASRLSWQLEQLIKLAPIAVQIVDESNINCWNIVVVENV